MPLTIASATKQNGRQELARRTGGMVRGTTTAAGGTTTAVDSGVAGEGDGFYDDHFLLLTGGTYSGYYRKVSKAAPDPAYISSTGTFTWRRVLPGASGSGSTYEVYPFDPTWYTQALREAAVKVQLRPVRAYISTHQPANTGSLAHVFTLPDHLQRVRRVEVAGREAVVDDFASLSGWTDVSGTAQVSSGRFSWATDANGNLAVRSSDPELTDGYMEFVCSGDVDTDYDIIAGVFRYIDSTNYLLVRFSSDDLIAVYVAGNATPLSSATFVTTSGSDYKIGVSWVGSRIQVWVNGTQYLDFTLAAAETKYLAGTNIGFLESLSGAPNTEASVDNLRAYSLVDGIHVPLWDFERPQLTLENHYGGYLLLVHGYAPFSQVAIDTADGILTTDTTATIECAADAEDPVWELLMNYAVAFLYRTASFPGNIASEKQRAIYEGKAKTAWAWAESQYHSYAPQRVKTELRGVRY